VIGAHALQAGSLVSPERLRFDFTHYNPLSSEELDRIEELVNAAVLDNIDVQVHENVTLEAAKRMGATMLFDEKYGERVRVVEIDDLSTELCGGTHASRTGDVGLFKILHEGSISAGVRRIEAVTNIDAYQLQKRQDGILKGLTALVNTDSENLNDKVRALQEEINELRKKLSQERKRGIAQVFDPGRDMEQSGRFSIARVTLGSASQNEMRDLSDRIRAKGGLTVAVVSAVSEGKLSVVLSVSDDAVREGVHAGKLLQKSLAPLGGKGGGRPHLAQGGGIGEGDLDALVKKISEELEKR
jgi:alanyl-tRNA synthetase